MPGNQFHDLLRVTKRDPSYAAINILGLTIGMVCSIFIFLWVYDELTYDSTHQNKDRIFALLEHVTYPGGEVTTYSSSPAPMATKLKEDLPEIEFAVRSSWPERRLFTSDKVSSKHEGVFADPTLFNVFTAPIAIGNPAQPLPSLHSIAVSRSMAIALFATVNAVGQSLRLNDTTVLTVSCVFDDLPVNSTLWFDYVIPYDLLPLEFNEPIAWSNFDSYTYLMLRDESDRLAVEEKIKAMLTHVPPSLPVLASDGSETMDFFLLPMKDWRLRDHFENGIQTGGRIVYVVSFSLAGAILLLIGCINFMNLATANARKRAKEIGIRKVVGASRSSLLRKFLAESLLISFVSLFLALLFVHMLLPLLRDLTGKHLFIDYSQWTISVGLLLIATLTGLAAGSYPAIYLSSLKPASIIRGDNFSHFRGLRFRKSLVLIQFSISIAMIICAQVVNEQIDYIRSRELGFDRFNVLYINPRPSLAKNYESFRSELLNHASISMVGRGDSHPMNIFNNDYATWPGIPSDQPQTIQSSGCDFEYLQTMGFVLKEGRFFSRDLASDSASFIINESMASRMGNDSPLGKEMTVFKFSGKVVGVVKDFNNNDLRAGIDPVVFVPVQGDFDDPLTIFVRYHAGMQQDALAHLQSVFKKFEPDYPLEYEFLDSTFERAYRGDILMGRLSFWFMGVAIVVSCLGLFGLALFTSERRVKEIGIRKVLGASVSNVVIMICTEFSGPIMMATWIGSLPAYYFVDRFLNQYTFHTSLTGWVFVSSASILVVVAFATIIHQSIKAARGNPVDALRAN